MINAANEDHQGVCVQGCHLIKASGTMHGQSLLSMDYANILERLNIMFLISLNQSRKVSPLCREGGGYEKLVSFAYSLKRRPSTPYYVAQTQRSYQRSLNEALCVLQTYFRISL